MKPGYKFMYKDYYNYPAKDYKEINNYFKDYNKELNRKDVLFILKRIPNTTEYQPIIYAKTPEGLKAALRFVSDYGWFEYELID